MTEPEPEILFFREGALGRVLLNRPAVVNALTYDMVRALGDQLDAWGTDASVATVLIQGAGERGLCAGGDIVGLYNQIRAGGDGAALFLSREYAMNLAIANYPKPYVAIMDGLVLGGGVGVSAHGSVRVVTERTRIGMPEVGIGFVPDVGGTWLLSHGPGELGTHAALTGGTFSGADAIELGLADHFVPAERIPALVEALASTSAADAVAQFAIAPPVSELAASSPWIDECYDSDSAIEIVAVLAASADERARAAADVIRTKSPLAVAVTLESLRRARTVSLARALDTEFRVSIHFTRGTEMPEGIRAQVIDKDRTPHWSPSTLAQITREEVESFFVPLETGELALSDEAGEDV